MRSLSVVTVKRQTCCLYDFKRTSQSYRKRVWMWLHGDSSGFLPSLSSPLSSSLPFPPLPSPSFPFPSFPFFFPFLPFPILSFSLVVLVTCCQSLGTPFWSPEWHFCTGSQRQKGPFCFSASTPFLWPLGLFIGSSRSCGQERRVAPGSQELARHPHVGLGDLLLSINTFIGYHHHTRHHTRMSMGQYQIKAPP